MNRTSSIDTPDEPYNGPCAPPLTLLFSTSGQYLKTDRGILHISSLNLSPDFLEQMRGLFVSNDWVIEEGKGILWLPPDYRAAWAAVWDGMVVPE